MSTATATRERPILFSGPMVRAILDGHKTQTRRVMKPQPSTRTDGSLYFGWASFWENGTVFTWDRNGTGGQNWNANEHPNEDRYAEALKRTPYEDPCPYGRPGDRPWVRETWRAIVSGRLSGGTDYRADDPGASGEGFIPWRPSIFMPRDRSRITLEVTDVRVQRLQEIIAGDIWQEGIRPDGVAPSAGDGEGDSVDPIPLLYDEFRSTWDKLNSPRGFGWNSNPFVWAISFNVCQSN